MKILVTNDDGIRSPGLAALARAVSCFGEIIVCAPENEQSAVGRALTMNRPLRLEQASIAGLDCPCYSVDGTPTDCVKLAISRLYDTPPDLVVSGINRGANLGSDVLFSGTVAAAMEGAMQGIPSVAVSLSGLGCPWNFEAAAEWGAKAVRLAIGHKLPFGTVMNVNIPACQPKGMKCTKLGVLEYGESYDKRTDPRGRSYYWLAGDKQPAHEHSDADDAWLERGYITITPLKCDMTDYDLLENWILLADKESFID